ncbi:hypothetical protein [Chamaesiphon sp. OTE_75_metabat_556]|uniref:hypothetical protein n=1 Tax=Chamaesiphon sp. OTE_75_metabat_556 TaxID=2964692 RepID=UPI00286AB72D|nr:hypothetical protein [Chamaesiphon sp. OTE_75_metabat_556]
MAAWAIGAAIAGAGGAVIGATLGGAKEFALSAAEDYDKHREIDWSKAINRGASGAASGAAFGFGFGVVSTIPGGQIVLGLAITAGVYSGAQKATGHFRDGEWAQGIVESVDLGLNLYGGTHTINKAFGEISQIGKGLGGSGRTPELAFAGGNYGTAGDTLTLPTPQTSGLIGGGITGHDSSDLFKPYFEQHLPQNDGNWEGARGESPWKSDKPRVNIAILNQNSIHGTIIFNVQSYRSR